MHRSQSFKRQLLHKLALSRQVERRANYTNLCDYHAGFYECDYVSPYTASASNVNASVFLLLQDWSSRDWLRAHRSETIRQHGHDPQLPTNRNLKRLLAEHLNLELSDTYATNLFPLIKPGPLGTHIPRRHLEWAARRFAKPQVAIVRPQLVICFGLQTYNAIRVAIGKRPYRYLRNALLAACRWGRTRIVCQPHPGARGDLTLRLTTGRRAQDYWRRMVRFVK